MGDGKKLLLWGKTHMTTIIADGTVSKVKTLLTTIIAGETKILLQDRMHMANIILPVERSRGQKCS